MKSLRSRLLALVLVLLTVVSLVVGVVTVLALRDFLIGRVDQQLVELSGPIGPPLARHRPRLPGQDPNVPGVLYQPGLPGGTVALEGNRSGLLRPGDQPRQLTAGEQTALSGVPADGMPHTSAVGDLGNYRLLRTPRDIVIGVPLADVEATTTRLTWLFAAVALSGLVLAGLAATLLVRRSLRPLRRVASVATRVSELPLSDGEVELAERVPDADTDPRTEVGQVGTALNRMLTHVETALTVRHESEQRVRRFVADASHELRTPLAAIRGYAEVAQRGAEPVPPDVAFALSRVESQADRMSALVDDLLLLARLDSGRPLERVEVDLSRVVVDAVQDAHVAGPSHPWELAMPPTSLYVLGDPSRLHQVVANLLTNARVHTPPGTAVRISLAEQGSTAVLTIADNGPGIPPNLLPEVFERFARGDDSRSRREHGPSTGLGLAIVHAVVSAHRGRVTVASSPGRTVFTVTLPTLTAAS